ncbi:MAG: hypothetical protein ACT4SY_07190 [Hyphomicrobiales bacterium]
MRRLILHVGSPKAGSSSLQKFFFINREALAEKGILFPVVPGEGRRSHAALPMSIAGHRLGPNQGGLNFAALKQIVDASSARTFVVSSEFFTWGRNFPDIVARVNDLVAAAGLSLTVVACVRPPHLSINSSFTQATKSFKNAQRFDKFCERILSHDRYDPLVVFKPWMEIQRSTFVALPFASEHLMPDLESAFFRAVSIGHVTEEFLAGLPRALANVSPGPMTVEAYRLVTARAGILENFDARKPILRRMISGAALNLGWDRQPFMGLTDELRTAIWRRFAATNDEFARRVWGQSWDEVFAAELARKFVPNEITRDSCPEEDWNLLQETVEAALQILAAA